MAHYQQLKFVEILSSNFPKFFSNKKILEIGSWNVSGSVRQFFIDCDYTGVDVSAGPGVDIVCYGQDLNLPDKSFDVVISCECFEHNPAWITTFNNMYRMLNDDGIFVLTCATYGRREHGTPRRAMQSSLTSSDEGGEYYLNLSDKDFYSAIPVARLFSHHKFFYNPFGRDLYFLGFKSPNNFISDDLIGRVNSIGLEKKNRFLSRFLKKMKFKIIFWLTSLIGDKKYQDFRFLISSKK